MSSQASLKTLGALFLSIWLSTATFIMVQGRQRTALVTTPYFAFYSDFETNLNDALIAAGTDRNFDRPELFRSGPEQSCFNALPEPVRAAWERAVEYYAQIISVTDNEREVYLIRMHLLDFNDQLEKPEDRQFVEIASSFRAAAHPAYRACRWAIQDAENRHWIEARKEQLAIFEEELANRLKDLYHKPLGGLPIPVDIVETVSWSGANTILRFPAGGHLLISNSYEGHAALEIVFHEASHTLMGRRSPVRLALAEAARERDQPLPRELWHVVLFYTTGETVRRALAAHGIEEYTPMIFGIWERGAWVQFREGVEKIWPAYLNSERTLAEAASELLQAIAEKKPADQ